MKQGNILLGYIIFFMCLILIQQKWKSRSRSRMLELTRNRPLISLVHDVKVNSAVLFYCNLFGIKDTNL